MRDITIRIDLTSRELYLYHDEYLDVKCYYLYSLNDIPGLIKQYFNFIDNLRESE